MHSRLLHLFNNGFVQMVMFAIWQILILGALILAATCFWLREDIPQLPDNLRNISIRLPTEIYSSDGELLKVLGERVFVSLDSISPHFQNAIIAAEDSGFYEHYGINHLSFLRAIYVNFKNMRIVQGASTITQQLSKNLFFSFEKTWLRKLKELLLAFQMETAFGKNEILEAYCNQVYFGNGVYGIEQASRYYFETSARELTLIQAAILAGIPKSPNKNNPFADVNVAMKRARYILGRMETENFITAETIAAALKTDIRMATRDIMPDPNSFFLDLALNGLVKLYGREFIYSGGLRITTTLDSKMQAAAQESANEHLAFLKTRMAESGKESLETALVCIDNRTGAVRAMLGGADYSASQFNRAISDNRSPGSSFKPFVYFSAMQNLGYHPATSLVDEPVALDIPGTKLWKPRNFGASFQGEVTLKEALAKSLNIISIKLIYRLRPDKVIRTARKFGIRSPLKANYSIALGASGVSPMEMASAYSVIANSGVLRETFLISRIDDYNGNMLYGHYIANDRRVPADTNYLLLDMMKGVVENGSGKIVRRMGFDHPAGGKTGTTNDFRDSWFSGFTRHFSTSVWVGYDSNKSMKRQNNVGLTGSQGAAPIWALFMKKVHKGLPKTDFIVPQGVRFENVNRKTGMPAEKDSDESVQVALREGDKLIQSARDGATSQKTEVNSPALIRNAF